MTKKDIVRTISEELGWTQLRTKDIVQKVFNAIVETLVNERRIELRNFGVFEVNRRASRKVSNPRTNEKGFCTGEVCRNVQTGAEHGKPRRGVMGSSYGKQ